MFVKDDLGRLTIEVETVSPACDSYVVILSTLAIASETMRSVAAEYNPDAHFTQHTTEGPDIGFRGDLDVAIIIDTVFAEAFGRTWKD